MISPKVSQLSVIMPSYNTDSFLSEAIESILNQTFREFELLVLDDCSTDKSLVIAESYERVDSRVRVISSDRNRGISATLNKGLLAARNEWVALMDGDDISLPSRFSHQIEYLACHPELVAVGCIPLMIDEDGGPIGTLPIYDESHEQIEARLLNGEGWAFLQPTAVLKRSIALQLGGYCENLATSMDLDFFLRLGEIGRLANIPEILYHYRMRAKSVTHASTRANIDRHNTVLLEAYARRKLVAPVPQENLMVHLPEPVDHYLKWGWWALSNGNVETARRQAIKALRLRPFSSECYRLAFCAMRGY